MAEHPSDDGGQTHDIRRRSLILSGASVAGALTITGCLGDHDGSSGVEDSNGQDDDGSAQSTHIAEAEPQGQSIDRTAISWADLGDLAGEITIYSGRTRDQIDPVFVALEEEYPDLTIHRDWDDNDVQVNQLVQEGDATPADLMYSQDPGALGELKRNGLVQRLPEDVINAVPESFREPDGYWTGVTGRVRAILYNEDRWENGDFPADILDFATDERFGGIISTRPNSGTFRGFIQAMVELEGEETTRAWIRDMIDNQNVQLFSGGSDQAEAVNRGGDDDPILALGNSYYAARILMEDPDAPIRVTFTENDPGCLFSIAGVGVTNNVDNPTLVAEFIRHLLAAEGQEFMMQANGEYPVIQGIEYIGPLPDLEDVNPPTFDLSSFDMELQEAQDLLRDEGMTV